MKLFLRNFLISYDMQFNMIANLVPFTSLITKSLNEIN